MGGGVPKGKGGTVERRVARAPAISLHRVKQAVDTGNTSNTGKQAIQAIQANRQHKYYLSKQAIQASRQNRQYKQTRNTTFSSTLFLEFIGLDMSP